MCPPTHILPLGAMPGAIIIAPLGGAGFTLTTICAWQIKPEIANTLMKNNLMTFMILLFY